MALQFYLVPNLMTADPNDHMAVTVSGKSYTIEDVYDEMTHEGSTVTKAEALASFEEIVRGIIRLASEGKSIVTPLVNISPRVVGVFNNENDGFDRSRHQVKLRVSIGSRLREVEGKISVEKTAPKERQPVLVNYHDAGSETQNEVLTPSGGARITGNLLKFDESAADQGIFFVNTATGAATKVPTKPLKNKPGELIFMNPALAPGNYKLEVRAKLKDNSQLKTGVLDEVLTIS